MSESPRDTTIPQQLREQSTPGRLEPAPDTSLHDSTTTSSEPVLTGHLFPSCFYTGGLHNADYPGLSSTAGSTLYGSAFKGAHHALAPTKDCMTPRMLNLLSSDDIFILKTAHTRLTKLNRPEVFRQLKNTVQCVFKLACHLCTLVTSSRSV
ncbi:hypothetical protein C8R45DRAFT_939052 [Mycena sanguinolenta]|nr:hypothetical protein C8R45DRAFT_939052 [Mycena sanguinolenta]